jgi:hypothetical protein
MEQQPRPPPPLPILLLNEQPAFFTLLLASMRLPDSPSSAKLLSTSMASLASPSSAVKGLGCCSMNMESEKSASRIISSASCQSSVPE